MSLGREIDRPAQAGRSFFNNPLLLQFLSGIAFLVTIVTAAFYITNPTEFQYWVFRVILSLAAAALGGVASGVVNINVSSVIRVGGAAVTGAAVYLIDPPDLMFDKNAREFIRLLSIADGEVADNQLSDARDKYIEAAKDDPKSWRPLYGLGRIAYLMGDYQESSGYLKEAITKPNAERKILVQSALVKEGMEDFGGAFDTLQEFIDHGSVADDSYKDAVFSRGQLEMWLYYVKGDIHTLDAARADFVEFIDLKGTPTQWAYYHLACIDGIEISLAQSSVVQRKEVGREDLETNLKKSREGFEQYWGETRQYHQFLLQRLLRQNGVFKQRPGDPVPCRRLTPQVLEEIRAQLGTADDDDQTHCGR